MTRMRRLKTNFSAGELSPDLLGRADLRAYDNGAAVLGNVLVLPTGGVTRRPGLRHVDSAPGAGRLVAFEFNTEQTYLLLFTDLAMAVYRDGVRLAEIAAPWSAARLAQIVWTQNADTLFVCHPDIAPQRITRTADDAWSIAGFAFLDDSDGLHQPYHRFADPGLTLQPSATTGAITLTASAALFDAGHAGARFRIGGREVRIDSVASSTLANATVLQALASTAATADWDEPAFSPARGWPVSVAFHQDRLVFGGSRDLPNRVWMSRTADIANFDLGSGLDDEAIEFALLSDQVNAIRWVFPGRHLQVFTTGAEWMISGEPLTPARVQARRQTRVGSCTDCAIPPRNVDGATLFIARNRRELREFLFTDVEQAYQATDLAILSRHLFAEPVDQDYDASGRTLYVVMAGGGIAALTLHRAEQVTAWTSLSTDGGFHAVAVVGDETYVLTKRAGAWAVELFDAALGADAGLAGSADPPATHWSGLDHLEGRAVTVVGDGRALGTFSVGDGAVDLDVAVSSVAIGLPFSHVVEPLPVAVATARGAAVDSPLRLVRATFRLRDTVALRADMGGGLADMPFQRFGPQAVLDRAPAPYTGDKTLRGRGWRRAADGPLWRIEQDAPPPFTLLSVTTEIKVND